MQAIRNLYTNLIYEKILQTSFPHASLILRALVKVDFERDSSFTIKKVLWNFRLDNIPLSEHLLRKGLNDLEKLGLVRTRPLMTRKQGRPAVIYTLTHPEYMRAKLSIDRDPGYLDEVPAESLGSLRDYRAAMHRALIARHNKQYSRRFLASRLGVSEATTRNYEKGTDIKVQPCWGKKRITYATAFDLPEKNKPGQYFLEITGKEPLNDEEFEALMAEYPEEHHKYFKWDNKYNRPMVDIKPRRCRAIRFLAQQAIRQGLEVHLMWRETNYYSIEGNEPLKQAG